MKIVLNGKDADVAEGTTIRDLLQQMKIVPELVACERNLEIVRRKDYASVRLAPGDRMEIIQMIGGG